MPSTRRRGSPPITPPAAGPDLTKRGGKYLFRMVSPSSVYARNLARYSSPRRSGKKDVAVVYGKSDWGRPGEGSLSSRS